MARRILSLWFPHLAAERALRAELGAQMDASAQVFAVVEMKSGAARLRSVTAAAARQGLAPGMSLADARARAPDLATTPAQPERDAAFLRALGRWCGRYTPWAALEGEDGLVLDLTGCAHLFGGEAALADEMSARFGAYGLTARIGLAETKGAAWALSRFAAAAVSIAPPGQVAAHVMALPVAALRLEAATAAGLARLGLRRIKDVARAPRASLARRFGPAATLRLDQLLGQAPEPIDAAPFARPHAARLSLPEPIATLDDLRAGLEKLLAALCARLTREGVGARQLRLSLRRVDRGEDSAEIGLARPCDDAARIAPLFESALAAMRADFGVDALRLEAVRVEPLRLQQREAFGARAADQGAALGDLITRLGNRIGFDRVTRFLPAESHIPERGFTQAPAAETAPIPFPKTGAPRPLSMFAPEPIAASPVPSSDPASPPSHFRWRGALFETALAIGPERIAPEWWRDDPSWRSGPRDYWRVQTRMGRRLWLFRTHVRTHAPGGVSTGAEGPGWFVQGEFA